MIQAPQDPYVHSYLFLRRAVGLIGLTLPAILIVGNRLTGDHDLRNSISGYYYSDMRDVFIGGMCAIGVFLIAYKGYGRFDDNLAYLAGFAGIALALCPTTSGKDLTRTTELGGKLHLVFAGLFFLSLVVFCFRFTKPDVLPVTVRKLVRNRVYVACGVIMLVCLVLIPISDHQSWLAASHPALWLETGATMAFGVAWLIKGQTLLRDKDEAAD